MATIKQLKQALIDESEKPVRKGRGWQAKEVPPVVVVPKVEALPEFEQRAKKEITVADLMDPEKKPAPLSAPAKKKDVGDTDATLKDQLEDAQRKRAIKLEYRVPLESDSLPFTVFEGGDFKVFYSLYGDLTTSVSFCGGGDFWADLFKIPKSVTTRGVVTDQTEASEDA